MGAQAVNPGFTRGEIEVAELMLQAKSYPEIARELGLTWGTIKNRVWIMFWKAGINSATGVARIKFTTWAHEHRGLLGIRCQACGERN